MKTNCVTSIRYFLFSSYTCEATVDQNLECKIPTKCLLKPFRSMRFLTKCATECKIHYAQDGDNLDVTLLTRFGAQISYSLRLLSDVELLEVDFDLDSLRSIVTCDSKFILGSLSNFHQVKGAGDLTLKVVGHQITLRSSVTDLVRKGTIINFSDSIRCIPSSIFTSLLIY